MGRKKRAIDYIALLKKMEDGGIKSSQAVEMTDADGELLSLEERVKKILAIVDDKKKNIGKMMFFVMYDIESNKVRRYVVKYLEKQGCTRIQRSIFLANLEMDKFNEIKNDLQEVQSVYENHDSILVVPITAEYLKAMKIIGQNINIDIIMQNRKTLFF